MAESITHILPVNRQPLPGAKEPDALRGYSREVDSVISKLWSEIAALKAEVAALKKGK